MKRLTLVAMVVAMVMAMVGGAWAAEGYATSGLASSGTASNCIVSALSYGKTPTITYLAATGGNSDNYVQFYTATAVAGVSATNSTTTVTLGPTNGLAAGGVVVIRHQNGDTYERRVIASVTATNVVLATAPSTETVPGDVIYAMTSAATLLTGTNFASGNTSIFYGKPECPILLDLKGTTVGANGITLVNVRWQ